MADRAPALSLARVSARLGGRAVLDGIDVEVEHGEVFAVLGPNGAGKSTLLRAAAGLLRVEGEVRLDGHPLHALDRAERARRLAYVPQQSALESPLSVRRVVAQGRYAFGRGLGGLSREDARRVDEALEIADVTELARRRFTELSHGERRRVLLARAIATSARLILLDEPTAALDVAHTLAFFTLLQRLASEGYALFVVLHDLAHVLDHADRALLLRRGAPVASGTVDEVVTPARVREVYGVEMVAGGSIGYRLAEAER